jgi:hypothetical protein
VNTYIRDCLNIPWSYPWDQWGFYRSMEAGPKSETAEAYNCGLQLHQPHLAEQHYASYKVSEAKIHLQIHTDKPHVLYSGTPTWHIDITLKGSMMVRYIQYCCFSGLRPSFSILIWDHHVLRAGFAPAFRWKHLFCWFRQMGLIPILGPGIGIR